MKGHGMVKFFFPWTTQRYYSQALSLVYAKPTMYDKRRPSFLVKANTCTENTQFSDIFYKG